MIKKIIALRGRGGIGKTTTINLIPGILTTSGWSLVSHVPHGNRIDRTDVYKNMKDNRLLGVASAGDNFREVNSALKILSDAGCETVICACRTSGGTHDAMNLYTKNITFVNKTIVNDGGTARRNQVNSDDANRLLAIV